MSKQDKQNRSNKVTERTDISHKVIVWLASAGIIIVVLVNAAISAYWGINGVPNECSAEAALLNTGIGIISLAITIWAGLSISNLVSRKDVDYLKATLEKLQQTTDAEVKPFIDQSQRTIFQQFLVEMERAQDDPIAQYFVKQFREKSGQSNIPYAQLIEIEALMAQVVSRHKSDYFYDEVLIKLAREGVESIERLENCTAIKEYLAYRKARFWFYMGYCDENRLQGAKDFWQTSIALSQEDDFANQLNDNKRALAYLNNMIGESYSKILHYYWDVMNGGTDSEKEQYAKEFKSEIDIIAHYAIRFCRQAVESMPTSVYCRDLGCVYERLERISKLDDDTTGRKNYSKDIIDTYLKSVSSAIKESSVPNETSEKAFRVLLMYYKAYLGRLIKYGDCARQVCDACKEHISNMYAYATVAKSDFPHCLRFQKLYAFSCYFAFRALNMGVTISSASGKPSGYFKNEIKYSLQGTTQGNGLTGGLPPVRFSM